MKSTATDITSGAKLYVEASSRPPVRPKLYDNTPPAIKA